MKNELTAIANELRREANLTVGYSGRILTVLCNRLDALAARGETAPESDNGTAEPFLNAIESKARKVGQVIGWTEGSVEMGVRCARGAMDPRTWESPTPSDAASGQEHEIRRTREVAEALRRWHYAEHIPTGLALTGTRLIDYADAVDAVCERATHSPAHADAEPRITADVEAVGGINLADVRRRTVAERDYWLDQLTMEVGYLRKRLRSRPASGSGDTAARDLLTEALDLVPRISDDDPMVPALADWCRKVRVALASPPSGTTHTEES